MIVYQMFTGKAFTNFKDLESKAKYIKYLGCDALWITPFLKSKSYHKYDAESLYEIDNELGTIEDFKQCVKTLNKHGIELMMDFVCTHTSNHCEWFKLSEQRHPQYNDWYVWSDTKGEYHKDDNCHDQSGDNQWHWSEKRQQYYMGSFCAEMPNLNLKNNKVKEELIKSVKYWCDNGVQHLRLDSVKHIYSENNLDFWRWFRRECKKIGIGTIVGECWSDANTVNSYAKAIGSCFDFPAKYQIQDCINQNRMRDLPYELHYLSRVYTNMLGSFLDNHDDCRIASTLDGDLDKIKYATSFLLTGRGDTYIYYGSEIGKQGVKWNGDEYVRTNIDNDNTNIELFELYQNLIEIRKNSDVLQYGDILPLETDKRNSACFERKFYNNSIYVAIVGEDDTHVQVPWGEYNALYVNGYKGEWNFYGQPLTKGIYILEKL